VKCLPLGLSSENKTAELTFFEGLSLLSGFYADAARERELVKSYVLNQQSEALNDEQWAAELDQLINDRLRATKVSAELRTLSSVIAEEGIEHIDLLKINVEKSELDVLRGLGPGDWSKIRQLVVEVDRREHLEPITSLLERHGFEILVEQDPLLRKTELCYVYAIRPSAAGPRLIRQQSPAAHVRSLPSVDEEILTPTTLRKYLKERLPQYMIPAHFVLLAALPLTPNGKVDRKALPAPEGAANAARAYEAPVGEVEITLAQIWAEVLKLERVGRQDHFFELGGHSLLATQVISRARHKFDLHIPLKMMFEEPRLAGFADYIAMLDWSRQANEESGNVGEVERIRI
jgi:FkbM family methyltransferase